jgi:hypothetical protein
MFLLNVLEVPERVANIYRKIIIIFLKIFLICNYMSTCVASGLIRGVLQCVAQQSQANQRFSENLGNIIL